MYRRIIVVAVSCLAIIAPEYAAHAQGPRWRDDELTGISVAIVTGTVRQVSAGRDPQVGYLYTYVTVDVDDVIKGRLDRSTIVLKQLGGRVGDLEMVVFDQAQFAPDEEVLLFLSRRPRDGTLQTTALWQGKWTIEREPVSGDRVALRSPFAERPGLGARNLRSGDDVRLMAPFRAELRAWGRERAERVQSRRPLRTVPLEPVPSDDGVAAAGATASEAAASTSAGFTLLGSGARWHQADDGVAVLVDVQASGQSGLSGGGFAEIGASRGLWNQAGSSLSLAAGNQRHGAGLSASRLCSDSNLFDGRLTIYFGDPCNEIPNDGTLAIGGFYSSSIETRTINGTMFRQIVKGYVINSDEGGVAGWLRTSQCFQDVQTHELGHAFGLGHSATPGNIMNPVIDNACLQKPPRPGTGELGGDDVDGVRFIYPAGVAPGPVLPAAPSALTIRSASPDSIALQWTDNADNENSFKLQRRADGGGWTTVWLYAGTTRYSDTGLAAGTHCYRIRSHNADGYSQYTVSTPACVSISGSVARPDDGTPAAPSGLSAVVTSSGRVRLSWTDNADDENSFKLQRRSPGGSWKTVWLLHDVTSYADVVPGSGDYCYRVRAHSPDGYSSWAWSTPACVTVDVGSGGGSPGPPGPAVPSDLIATAISPDRIDLHWVDNAADELGFKMQRRRDGGAWQTIWLYRNTTYYSDRGLPAGSYCYRIRSYDAEVSSSYTSSALSCTTIGR